jgi:flagellar basal body-associated protein FliL
MKVIKYIAIFASIIVLLTIWTFFSKLQDKGAWEKERQINRVAQQCYSQDQEVRIFIDDEDKFVIECKIKEYLIDYGTEIPN